MKIKTPVKIIISIIVIGSIYAMGFWHGSAFEKDKFLSAPPAGTENANPPSQIGKVDMSNFWKTWQLLEQSYVDANKIDNQKLIQGAIHGLVGALGDPFSVYFERQESKKFNEDVSGQFQGIGIEIGIKKGVISVIAPLKGTPADKAGLKAGDAIFAINGTSTASMTLDEAVNNIRGPKNTVVKLTIMRDAFEKPKAFEISRDVIVIKSVESEMLTNNIGKIAIYNFNENSADEFAKSTGKIKNAKGIIIDLRNNPGGFLERAVDIAGWFVPSDSVVVKEQLAGGQKGDEYTAHGNEMFLHTPIVVLADNGSASAAEILAGALRDLRQAPLVGVTTFGKGSVQQLFSLGDGSSIKLTIAKWLTPNGQQIHGIGLKPDYDVKFPDTYKEGDKDPQLEKAIGVLQNQITK